jgi:hypothetical protein
MEIARKFRFKISCYTLLLLAFFTCSSLSADSPSKGAASQQLYFYIPVSFWPNSEGIERCLSKDVYQQAGVQLLHSPSGYHVSMGNYVLPSKGSATDVAFRIQKLVRNSFSKFTAQVDNNHDGITVFGKFVVIVLKTDKKKGNRHRDLFQIIHKKITKLVLANGGIQVGFLNFRPHCSIASVIDTSAPSFLNIRNRLLKSLATPVSKVHITVNPRILQYRISPQPT